MPFVKTSTGKTIFVPEKKKKPRTQAQKAQSQIETAQNAIKGINERGRTGNVASLQSSIKSNRKIAQQDMTAAQRAAAGLPQRGQNKGESTAQFIQRTGGGLNVAQREALKANSAGTNFRNPGDVEIINGREVTFGEIDKAKGTQRQTAVKIPGGSDTSGGFFDSLGEGNGGVTDTNITDDTESGVTTEDKAKAKIEEERQKNLKLAESLNIDTDGIFLTNEELVARIKEEQKEQRSQLEQRIDFLNAQDDAQAKRKQENLEASEGATTAGFAQSREGLESSGALKLTQQFSKRTQDIISENTAKLNQAKNQRANLLRQLDKAQKAQNESLIETIGQQLAGAENQIDKAQLDLAKAANDNLKQAKNFLDFIGDSGIAATMDVAELGDTLQSFGVPRAFAGSLHSAAMQAKEAEGLAKTEAEWRVAKLMKEVKNVGNIKPTTAIQEFEFVQGLKERGFSDQAIEEFKVRAGFVETPLEEARRKDLETKAEDISPLISNNTGGSNIDIQKIGVGAPLPLNSLGDSSKNLRTDRHNNPIASKAYPSMIDRLEKAGLKQGEDFDFGETTQGIDSDSVATIMFKDASTGVLGSLVELEGGAISRWYANPKYGGAGLIQNKISSLSGQSIDSNNAQDAFNALDAAEKTEVLKEIYKHEGGTQLFKEGGTQESSVLQEFKSQAEELGLFGKEADEFARKQLDASFKAMTDPQNKSFDAYVKMEPELEIYDSLFEEIEQDPDAQDALADAMGFIVRKAKDDDIFADVVNELKIKDPKVRRLLLSEMRWIEAALRKESGAAISVGEYKSKGRSNFARPGDDFEAREDKRLSRRRSTKANFVTSGPAGQRQAIEFLEGGEQRKTKSRAEASGLTFGKTNRY